MPLRLDIKKKLSARSDRVKSIDIHPSEPWILSALYNGHVYIWNYTTQALVKTFEISDLPVRTAKFIARKQWVVAGADDMNIRVYNYNTMEKIKTFEAHTDYIRCVVVHPTLPYILTSSDDMLIKLWDWDKGWSNTMTFEGHTHYVMTIAINPKDTNTFATASLDRTVKVWGLSSTQPHFTLEGHDKGVNCVEYFVGGEKPYLVSGADDKLVKVWDYQNKSCVQTLEGHTHNVSVVCFHPELPVIVSGSEDGTVRIWHANTYRLEKTLNYGMERVWAIAYLRGSHALALGYDDGTVMLKLGREEPVVSMEQNGKVIWARHNEIFTANVRTTLESGGVPVPDGERLPLSTKELGNCEVYPQTLKHSPNGRTVVVCGDGEYIIYTALAWRNKSFGQGLDFAWAQDSNYAVREGSGRIKTFANFTENKSFKPSYNVEGLFGGTLLGVRGASYIVFYDWEHCRIVRRIDVTTKGVYWSDQGEFLAIATDTGFFILKYNKDAVTEAFESGTPLPDDGIEEAFEVLHEVTERVRTAHWVGDCFLYTSHQNRLNYCVGGEVVTLAHLDRHMYLLGYIPQTNRVYLVDKGMNVVSYTLHISIINYQTAILRKDFAAAQEILPKIPNDHRNRIAHFLESQGLREDALEVSIDPDHRFELAMQLGRLDIAKDIAGTAESEQKWKVLADAAFSATPSQLDLAESCLRQAEDLSGLLLLYTSTGDQAGLTRLAETAKEKGRFNIAFIGYFLLHRLEDCLDLLCSTGRIPEAAFLARTYLPSHVSRIVKLWREDLNTINPKAAEALADPMEYANLFPDLAVALQAEQVFRGTSALHPASSYTQHKEDLYHNLIEEIKGLTPEELEAAIAKAEARQGRSLSQQAPVQSQPPKQAAPAPAPAPVSSPSPVPAAGRAASPPASPAPASPAPAVPSNRTPAVASPAPTSPSPVSPVASPSPVRSPVMDDEEEEGWGNEEDDQ
eukprot:TRINITY_DN1220_c0_g1_i2.p1 TRINITY_DN1220_c0_g1~~TRINITY_DN1220_c0_g1_i2.p1  ORF type:complete len:965 (-),score=332.68 TRINITY_DN1220_c0_g1_i2:75-2969(-)